MDYLTKNKYWYFGFFSFWAFQANLAFKFHEPLYLFYLCFIGFAAWFQYINEKVSFLKYFGYLAVPAFIIGLLGVFGIIRV